MKGPPGEICQSLKIDLPDNRNQISTRSLAAFLSYRKQLYDAIAEN
jgi:hypothetical protein